MSIIGSGAMTSSPWGDYKEQITSLALSDEITRYQKDYETSFQVAYGKKELKSLANAYVQKQQQTAANIEAAITIGSMAFSGCRSIPSISIPAGLRSIGAGAFYSCSRLENVVFGEGVTSIGDCAFGESLELTEVIIPKSVTEIGNCSFYSCGNLTDVYYNGSESEWAKIQIGSDNNHLTDANIHYNVQ